MSSSKTRAVLLLVMTFASGVAAGVAGDRFDLIPAVAEATEPALETDPSDDKKQTAIEYFSDNLGLTVEQRFEVEILLDYYRSSAHDLQKTVRPQYQALMDSVRTKMEAILSDDQVEKFRDILQKYGPGKNRQNNPPYDQN